MADKLEALKAFAMANLKALSIGAAAGLIIGLMF